jgi:23S rRNA (uracil1939-C5)-methyltransferase
MNSSEKQSENLISLKIEDVSRGGSGVARNAEGRIVFVPFTAPGDEIKARIVDTKKNYS